MRFTNIRRYPLNGVRTEATRQLIQIVKASIDRSRERLTNGPLLVAVSGGADSLALLLSLIVVPSDEWLDIRIAHFSHGLRRTERRDADLVKQIASHYSLPLFHGHGNVPSLVRESGGSIEAEARKARYSFLTEAANQCGASAVALGHTLGDQAETVLLRLVRGAGLNGLGAMREWTPWTDQETGTTTNLFRPFLTIFRRDTEALCKEAGITPAYDASNHSLAYARNRIRHKIMPQLERLNPRAQQALARTAATVQTDETLLQTMASSVVDGHERWAGGSVTWPRGLLTTTPWPLLVRILQRAYKYLRGREAALSQAHLAAIASLLAGPSGKEVTLPDKLYFSVRYDDCSLGVTSHEPKLPLGEVSVAVPGSVPFGPWIVETNIWRDMPPIGSTTSPEEAPLTVTLDAERIGKSLTIRHRRPGDRFYPSGMPSAKRLQDFFVDAKIPKHERDGVPLVLTPDGIACVVGYRVASWAKVTPSSQLNLSIKFYRRAV